MTESPLEAQPPRGPAFSVVMPAYNAETTIDEVVESVLSQTFESWELVIVDDGSTGTTLEKAEALASRDSHSVWARAVASAHSPQTPQLETDDALWSYCLAARDLSRFIRLTTVAPLMPSSSGRTGVQADIVVMSDRTKVASPSAAPTSSCWPSTASTRVSSGSKMHD